MWEQWDPDCTAPGGAAGDSTSGCVGTGIDQQKTDSFSHGWGSVGITGILEGLLGIRVTGVGARTVAVASPAAGLSRARGATVTVAPPAAGLSRARGGEWTERGRVSVDWQRRAAEIALRLSVPDNMVVTVTLPASAGTRYVASGPGAPRYLGRSDGRARYQVGSGETSFLPVA